MCMFSSYMHSSLTAVQVFSATLIPGSEAVFFTDAGLGVETFDFANGLKNVTPTFTTIAGQGATCWASYSKHTGHFYAMGKRSLLS